MIKYYTRACNFFYGNKAKKLIKNRTGLPQCGNNKIEFTTNAKFIASGDELKSVYIFPNKNFLRNKCFSNNMILINGSENSSTSF